MGGGRPYLFLHASVTSFIKRGNDQLSGVHVFRYIDHADEIGCLAHPVEHGYVYADLSLTDIIPHLSKQMAQKIAQIHKIPLSSHWHLTKDQLVQVFEGHDCVNCNHYTSVLEAQMSPQLKKNIYLFANLSKEKKDERNSNSNVDNAQLDPSVPFPPPPLTEALKEIIVRDWCKDSKPSSLEESGCAVCGELVPISQLSRLKAIKTMLGVLEAPGVI
ncbi:hypothetical protein L208DRAFT_1331398 [Tricholoma matsutake]|nr:hypothetical protein L208DRAFT_1331398 [Tricholoma matsutake 945]